MAESLSGASSVEERIHFYSRTYHQLFPVNLDIGKVWEISILQADSILRDDSAKGSHAAILGSFLYDKSATSWTRAIAGASLVQYYSSRREESIAVSELIQILSPAPVAVGPESEHTHDSVEYTSNDIVMISMYALSLFRRIQTKNLLESLLNSCASTLENFSCQSSSTSKGFESSDKLCLSVLSTLISKGSNLHSTLRDVLENNSMELLKRFFSLLYPKNSFFLITREQVAKRLISPLVQLVGTSTTDEGMRGMLIDLTWSHCSRIVRENNGDLATCSILLCVLMSIPQLRTMERLGRRDLWDVLSLCFLSSDAVVRKRAAFVMQLIPNTPTSLVNPVEVEVSKRKEGKGKKPSKAQKNRGTDVAREEPVPVVIEEISFEGPPMLLNSLSGVRCWWSDFLDVYGQIEGCTSMHLVDQIWPQLEHLCRLAAVLEDQIDVTNVSITDDFCYPIVGFEWVKALLHVLLQISIPGIRKAVLRRILLGGGYTDTGLALSASRKTIRWFCFELLPLIDSVGFFSAYFLPQGVDVGCDEEDGESFLKHAKINVLAHPGILMPSFLSRLLRSLAAIDNSNMRGCGNELPLVNELIQSIVHVVCGENGLHSLSAAKWIVRVFAEPYVFALIPPCIGPTELKEMLAFFRGRLACSNGVVREHVLQGLLPLFLRGTDALTVSLTDLLQMVDGNTCFGLERIVAHSSSFSSLKSIVIDSSVAKLAGNTTGCPLNEIEGHLLAVMYTIVADRSTADEHQRDVSAETMTEVLIVLEKLCTGHLDVITQLYRSPYIKVEEQLKAIGFLNGIARTVALAHNHLSDSAGGIGKSLSILAPMRMLFPLLSVVQNSITDLSSYLSIALMSSLTATESSTAHSNGRSPVLIDTVSLLDDCSFILGTLLLVPNLIPSSSSSTPSTSSTSTSESPVLGVIIKTLDSLAALLSSATSSSIGTVLTVRCTVSLLSSLQTSWPHVRIHSETEKQIVGSISRVVSLLINITEPSSSAFRAFVSTIDSTDVNIHSKLLVNMAQTLACQFGRVSTMLVEYRWAGIRSGLDLLVLSDSNSSCVNSSVSERSSDDYLLFSLAIDQLDACSMSSLPDILSSCLVVVRRMSTDNDQGSRDRRAALLLKFLDVAWCTATGGSAYTDVRAINSFVRLAFDVSVLRSLDHDDVRSYYDKVEALGMKNRPHIMQSLVCALCAAWTADISLSIPFFPLIPRLLMYREPRQDDHNVPDNTGREGSGALEKEVIEKASDDRSPAGICRFSVLCFLESCLDADAVQLEKNEPNVILIECVNTLIVELVALNSRDDFVQAAMIGSDLYGQKLRCWQSLCVLTKYMSESILQSILEEYFTVLSTSAGHAIRVHIELFGAAMAIRFPSVMMPRLLLALIEFNHTQPTLCSIFVVLGHAVLRKTPPRLGPAGVVPSEGGIIVDIETAQAVVTHLLPWLACGAGLPRTVAQLLMHSLIPTVLSDTPIAESDSVTSFGNGRAYLQSIFQYLSLNTDSNKGMPKQRKFFNDFNPEDHCSVLGLSLIGLDNTGEVIAPHILTFLADTIKAEVEMERERERQQVSAVCNTAATTTLQTKRVPFDELQLSLESEVLSRQQNAAGRKRQEVVICASLIDKVTNLAGIARTCEIFAVQELVLANLGVVQSDVFQGIAVSCDQWLPMSEVPVHTLTTYLQNMRRKGYTILGLEQTDNSKNLGEYSELPGKCVLLLGREKEGIPIELLQEIDCCLEIPQYGVIRSLNVHVSAALAIWEITKQNKGFLENGTNNLKD